MSDVKFIDRKTNDLVEEKIYGEDLIKWLYEGKGSSCILSFLTRPLFSKLYGLHQSSFLSAKKIPQFIKDYHIPLKDFLPHEGRTEENPYKSFNEFFIRRFREEKRPFDKNSSRLPAFAEGRYFAYENVKDSDSFLIKNQELNLRELVGEKYVSTFAGGPLVIARLCPVDYHRFHYFDDGSLLDFQELKGPLHSVNPLALQAKSSILSTNQRQMSILKTKNFGTVAYIEVGALCVGKIVQSASMEKGSTFKRGEEKGYFLFGGSTVVIVGQQNSFTLDNDIKENTQRGLETFLRLGESFAGH